MIIRYRAWCVNAKEMKRVAKIDMTSDVITCEIEVNSECTYGPLFITGEDPDAVLMQSTGLKDKNGVDIYVGDIVKPVSFASWIGVVKYSPENAAYILDDHNNEFIRGENVYLSQFNEGLEVKGNIYENPELMEV
jgi:hypothetical protein